MDSSLDSDRPHFEFTDTDEEESSGMAGEVQLFEDEEEDIEFHQTENEAETSEASNDEDVRQFINELKSLNKARKKIKKISDKENDENVPQNSNTRRQNVQIKGKKKNTDRLIELAELGFRDKNEDKTNQGNKHNKKIDPNILERLNKRDTDAKVEEILKQEKKEAEEAHQKRIEESQFKNIARGTQENCIDQYFAKIPNDEGKITVEQLKELLKSMCIMDASNTKQYNQDSITNNKILDDKLPEWEVENERSSDKLYSVDKVHTSIKEALNENSNTKFDKFVKKRIFLAMVNGEIGLNRANRSNQELPPPEIVDPQKQKEEEKQKMIQMKQKEQNEQIAAKTVESKINEAFKGVPDIATNAQVASALFKLSLVTTITTKIDEVQSFSEVLPIWIAEQSEDQPTKYNTQNIISSLKESFSSKSGSDFNKFARQNLIFTLANGKLREMPQKKEHQPIKRDKFLVYQKKEENVERISRGSQALIKEKDLKSIADRVLDELKAKDDENKKRKEEVEEEENKRIEARKIDKKKEEEIRQKHQEAIMRISQENKEKKKSKVLPPTKMTYEEYLQKKEKDDGKAPEIPGYDKKINAMRKAWESHQKQPEVRMSYQEFEKKKSILFKEVKKPDGWDQKVQQMRLGYQLALKKKEEEARRKENYNSSPKSSRRSVSSFSSVSTLKENGNSHLLEIDEDSIVEPM